MIDQTLCIDSPRDIAHTSAVKLYYVINARLPSKKAYGIQIAKMCEAFIEQGVELELVIPATAAAKATSMREFYGLRVEVPTTVIATPDRYHRGRLGYLASSVAFSMGLWALFLRRRLRGEHGFYYSIPDRFSFVVAQLCRVPCIVEIHEPQQLSARLLHKARLVIATNGEIARVLQEAGMPRGSIVIEPNGVDLDAFAHMPQKSEARAKLGILSEARMALYVGRFYQWKGLEILAEAAKEASEVAWYVLGGTLEEFQAASGIKDLPGNLHIAGEAAPQDVPQWLAAADVLLILGTKANETSYRYTAPMKVFEYMAAQRPMVASATPALKSIIGESLVRFYEPDDAVSLADAVRKTLAANTAEMVALAAEEAANHTWQARAKRISAHVADL